MCSIAWQVMHILRLGDKGKKQGVRPFVVLIKVPDEFHNGLRAIQLTNNAFFGLKTIYSSPSLSARVFRLSKSEVGFLYLLGQIVT